MANCDKFKLEADTDAGDNVDAVRVGESVGWYLVEHFDIGRAAKLKADDRCEVHFFGEATERRAIPRRMATAVEPGSTMVGLMVR